MFDNIDDLITEDKKTITDDKKVMGRPKKASYEKKDKRIVSYLTSSEMYDLEDIANKSDITVSQLARKVILDLIEQNKTYTSKTYKILEEYQLFKAFKDTVIIWQEADLEDLIKKEYNHSEMNKSEWAESILTMILQRAEEKEEDNRALWFQFSGYKLEKKEK